MREAAKKIIEYAIQTLGLKTIDAYTHKDSQSSTNLLKKLKFTSTDNVDESNSNLILFPRIGISSLVNPRKGIICQRTYTINTLLTLPCPQITLK